MRVVKIENANCNGEVNGTLVTVNTEISDKTSASDALAMMKSELESQQYQFMPSDISSCDGIKASQFKLRPHTDLSGFDVVTAWDWLAEHGTNNIIYGIQQIFDNDNIHVWFVSFWVGDEDFSLIK